MVEIIFGADKKLNRQMELLKFPNSLLGDMQKCPVGMFISRHCGQVFWSIITLDPVDMMYHPTFGQGFFISGLPYNPVLCSIFSIGSQDKNITRTLISYATTFPTRTIFAFYSLAIAFLAEFRSLKFWLSTFWAGIIVTAFSSLFVTLCAAIGTILSSISFRVEIPTTNWAYTHKHSSHMYIVSY